MSTFWAMIIGLSVLSILIDRVTKGTKRKSRKSKKNSAPKAKSTNSNWREVRPDEIILSTPLQELTIFEFERLLALYFRDQGFVVEETGVGGNDGGVDLVITDARGERTAVQAKRYADHNKVDVKIVRELVGAKRNHNCVLTLLITTSDLTIPAKEQAEKLQVDYWHGGIVERKLAAWGKYKPSKKKQHPVIREAAVARE